MSRPPRNPLIPLRDGVSPSCVAVPHFKLGASPWLCVLDFLAQRLPVVSRRSWADRLARAEVLDEHGRALNADAPCLSGARLYYYRQLEAEPAIPFEAELLFQDEHLLVVDKPHFLSMIPAGRHLRETLLSRLRLKLDLPELTPCHRLDRETAGVTLFCLHPPSRGAYQKLFEARSVHKTYEAIAPFRADLLLPRLHRSRLEEGEGFFTMGEVAGEPNSETLIELIERRGDWALYRLSPHTGKKHQLRAHLAALGIPIRHDPWYPVLQPEKGEDFSQPLQLLARSLRFIDPFSGELREFHSQRQLDPA